MPRVMQRSYRLRSSGLSSGPRPPRRRARSAVARAGFGASAPGSRRRADRPRATRGCSSRRSSRTSASGRRRCRRRRCRAPARPPPCARSAISSCSSASSDVGSCLAGELARPLERNAALVLVRVDALQIRIAPRRLAAPRRLRGAFGAAGLARWATAGMAVIMLTRSDGDRKLVITVHQAGSPCCSASDLTRTKCRGARHRHYDIPLRMRDGTLARAHGCCVLARGCGRLRAAAESSAARAAEWFTDAAEPSGLRFAHFNGMSGDLTDARNPGTGRGAVRLRQRRRSRRVRAAGPDARRGRRSARLFRRGPPLEGRLFRNDLDVHQDGTGRCTSPTSRRRAAYDATGYGMGVATGDFDNDGFVDLYLTNFGTNQLLPQQRQRHVHRRDEDRAARR